MNDTDYKAIAEILKNNYNCYPSDKLIHELANYFEKEAKTPSGINVFKIHHRKQFLKDCGVS